MTQQQNRFPDTGAHTAGFSDRAVRLSTAVGVLPPVSRAGRPARRWPCRVTAALPGAGGKGPCPEDRPPPAARGWGAAAPRRQPPSQGLTLTKAGGAAASSLRRAPWAPSSRGGGGASEAQTRVCSKSRAQRHSTAASHNTPGPPRPRAPLCPPLHSARPAPPRLAPRAGFLRPAPSAAPGPAPWQPEPRHSARLREYAPAPRDSDWAPCQSFRTECSISPSRGWGTVIPDRASSWQRPPSRLASLVRKSMLEVRPPASSLFDVLLRRRFGTKAESLGFIGTAFAGVAKKPLGNHAELNLFFTRHPNVKSEKQAVKDHSVNKCSVFETRLHSNRKALCCGLGKQ
ncbi:uncharacterized protein [Oryctolagus cuniculus]|uniref:uncharacterized protein n=1 Tax=Oryctolagus cuniculus TaxID=9986 RepID=UPI00387A2E37